MHNPALLHTLFSLWIWWFYYFCKERVTICTLNWSDQSDDCWSVLASLRSFCLSTEMQKPLVWLVITYFNTNLEEGFKVTLEIYCFNNQLKTIVFNLSNIVFKVCSLQFCVPNAPSSTNSWQRGRLTGQHCQHCYFELKSYFQHPELSLKMKKIIL